MIHIVPIAPREAWPVRLAAYSIRQPGVAPPAAQFDCDEDARTVHFGAVMDDTVVVGAAAITAGEASPRSPHDSPWRLRAMAVDPRHQSSGVGRALLRYAISHIADRGGGLLWGTIRHGAYGFYERHGFLLHDDIFTTRAGGSPHRYGELTI